MLAMDNRMLGEKIMKWTGIKQILEEAPQYLELSHEQGYYFYSAPKGYGLILSGVAIAPKTWKRPIKDIGWPQDHKRKDRIFWRGFDPGEGAVVSETEKPVLHLVKMEAV